MYLVNESRQLSNDEFGLYNVPLVDLFNHDRDEQIGIYYYEVEDEGEFGIGLYILANKNVAKGQQINWHYGNKGNHEFLKNYGFVLNDKSQLN